MNLTHLIIKSFLYIFVPGLLYIRQTDMQGKKDRLDRGRISLHNYPHLIMNDKHAELDITSW